jgi:hypothetical protein
VHIFSDRRRKIPGNNHAVGVSIYQSGNRYSHSFNSRAASSQIGNHLRNLIQDLIHFRLGFSAFLNLAILVH